MSNQKFLWLDLEMSGLDVESCRILECAAIVTDHKWQELATFETIVFQPDSVLDAMDAWCTKTHGESGLTAAVRNGVPEAEAEQNFLRFIEKEIGFSETDKIIIAGNSIGQDRKFLDRYWTNVSQKLHYRMLDVSSFKIVFNTSTINKVFEKKGAHRALDDIRESIAELKFYLNFVKP